MTKNEAIELLDKMKEPYEEEDNEALNMAIMALEEVQQYQAVGTVSECREAMEKQKAKKLAREKGDLFSGFINHCPVCGEIIAGVEISNYCHKCGQRLE